MGVGEGVEDGVGVGDGEGVIIGGRVVSCGVGDAMGAADGLEQAPSNTKLTRKIESSVFILGLTQERSAPHYILTGSPFSFRYFFACGIEISLKWKMDAASTADALPIVTAS